MISILTLFVVIVLSILVTRIAATILAHTGISRETARFQARSAFTGVGFTTSESENIVNHPVRRRVVLVLMLLGNAGIVTAVSSLILTFVGEEEQGDVALRIFLLVTGILVLWLLASSGWVDRLLSSGVERLLDRYTDLDVRDYASLMRLRDDYRLAELVVNEEDWIADRTLGDSELGEEGVLVLGILRSDGRYVGAPNKTTQVEAGDTLLVYGREDSLTEIDDRRRGHEGDRAHESSKRTQQSIEEAEAAEASECRKTHEAAKGERDPG